MGAEIVHYVPRDQLHRGSQNETGVIQLMLARCLPVASFAINCMQCAKQIALTGNPHMVQQGRPLHTELGDASQVCLAELVAPSTASRRIFAIPNFPGRAVFAALSNCGWSHVWNLRVVLS